MQPDRKLSAGAMPPISEKAPEAEVSTGLCRRTFIPWSSGARKHSGAKCPN